MWAEGATLWACPSQKADKWVWVAFYSQVQGGTESILSTQKGQGDATGLDSSCLWAPRTRRQGSAPALSDTVGYGSWQLGKAMLFLGGFHQALLSGCLPGQLVTDSLPVTFVLRVSKASLAYPRLPEH